MTEPTPPAPSATPPAEPATPPPALEPTAGDDLAKMQAALTKANDEAKKFRLELKELKDRDPVKDLLAKLGGTPEPGQDPTKALQDRLDAMEKRAAEAEARALRADVAAAKGLTAAQAKRLQGDTREQLEADADELRAAFATPAPAGNGLPSPDPSQGSRSGGADLHAAIASAMAAGNVGESIRLKSQRLEDIRNQ